MRTEELIELLSKPCWDYKDIMKYANVGQTQANKIKKRAIKERDGNVAYGSQYVYADSVLSLFGTSRADEINLISGLVKENSNEELR